MSGFLYRYRSNESVDRHIAASGPHPHTKAVQEIADMYDHDHDETDDSGDRPIGMGWQDEINNRAKQAGEALARPQLHHHTAFLEEMADNVVEPEHWGNDWMDQDTYAAGNHIANHARLALGMEPLPDHWMEARYRDNGDVDRHVNPGNIRDFGDDLLPGFHGPKFGLPKREVSGEGEPTHGQVPPPNTGMRSDGLRDALEELHDRGKIDLFSHMADFLSGVDEDEAGEHADIHRMAHKWALRQGYI